MTPSTSSNAASMHQKQPPAKIAVSDEAARLGEGPEPAASAASKRAVAAAKIHRAIMQISKLKLARSIRTSGKPG